MPRDVPLIHPGTILLKDWLKPMAISQYALAKAIDVPPRRINENVKGLRGITVDTALRLSVFFGTDAQSWVNLKTHYDTENARVAMAAILGRILPRGLAEADDTAHAQVAVLEHADFAIGREFWTETGCWRCTDVGTRTICAIKLEGDPRNWNGPPYAVVEHVFHQNDFGALYASRDSVPA